MKLLSIAILLAVFTTADAADMPANHPAVNHSAFTDPSAQPAPDIKTMQHAEVKSVLDTKGYTYIEVSRDDKPVWLAVSTTEVKAGDMVHYNDSPAVPNYTSRTLEKTFPSVMFLTQVVVNGGKQ